MAGAVEIFVSEPNTRRRKFIESLGLSVVVFDPMTDVVSERIREKTPHGVDGAVREGFDLLIAPGTERLKILVQPGS